MGQSLKSMVLVPALCSVQLSFAGAVCGGHSALQDAPREPNMA